MAILGNGPAARRLMPADDLVPDDVVGVARDLLAPETCAGLTRMASELRQLARLNPKDSQVLRSLAALMDVMAAR